jgi:hypothetical protein
MVPADDDARTASTAADGHGPLLRIRADFSHVCSDRSSAPSMIQLSKQARRIHACLRLYTIYHGWTRARNADTEYFRYCRAGRAKPGLTVQAMRSWTAAIATARNHPHIQISHHIHQSRCLVSLERSSRRRSVRIHLLPGAKVRAAALPLANGIFASPGKHLLISCTVKTMWPFYTAGMSNALI